MQQVESVGTDGNWRDGARTSSRTLFLLLLGSHKGLNRTARWVVHSRDGLGVDKSSQMGLGGIPIFSHSCWLNQGLPQGHHSPLRCH
jgi:hypothetical protein